MVIERSTLASPKKQLSYYYYGYELQWIQIESSALSVKYFLKYFFSLSNCPRDKIIWSFFQRFEYNVHFDDVIESETFTM